MSEYVDNLIALKAREAHDLKEIGDQWRTPDWLFFALDNLFLDDARKQMRKPA